MMSLTLRCPSSSSSGSRRCSTPPPSSSTTARPSRTTVGRSRGRPWPTRTEPDSSKWGRTRTPTRSSTASLADLNRRLVLRLLGLRRLRSAPAEPPASALRLLAVGVAVRIVVAVAAHAATHAVQHHADQWRGHLAQLLEGALCLALRRG